MSWLRLDCAWRRDARCIRAGRNGRDVFLAALEMAKLHRWKGGVIPAADFDAALVCHHLEWPHTETGAVSEGIEACIRVGLLIPAGDTIAIRSWSKHQTDPTGAKRQAEYRKRRNTVTGKRNTNKRNAVTETSLDAAVEQVVTSRNDVTPRQIDRQTEETPLTPPQGGGNSADADQEHERNGDRLRPRETIAVKVILDQLTRGAKGWRIQREADEQRKRFRAGDLPLEDQRTLLAKWADSFPQAISEAREGQRRTR